MNLQSSLENLLEQLKEALLFNLDPGTTDISKSIRFRNQSIELLIDNKVCLDGRLSQFKNVLKPYHEYEPEKYLSFLLLKAIFHDGHLTNINFNERREIAFDRFKSIHLVDITDQISCVGLDNESNKKRIAQFFLDEMFKNNTTFPPSWLSELDSAISQFKNHSTVKPEMRHMANHIFKEFDVIEELLSVTAFYTPGESSYKEALLNTINKWEFAIERETLIILAELPTKNVNNKIMAL